MEELDRGHVETRASEDPLRERDIRDLDVLFFFSSRRRHTSYIGDWSSDVCSSDLSKEPQKVLDAYGVKPGPEGSFARQCLMARRLSEAGVRFVEICQSGWDHHNGLQIGRASCRERVEMSVGAGGSERKRKAVRG